MNTPNLTEVLREYLADGGSREVYDNAKKELAALKSRPTPPLERAWYIIANMPRHDWTDNGMDLFDEGDFLERDKVLAILEQYLAK